MRERLHIKVPVPQGIPNNYRRLMEKRAVYTVPVPKIRQIRNAFVSHSGLVLKNGLLVSGCAFNLRGNEDKVFYYPFWRQTVEEYAVCRWGKSLLSIIVEEPCLVIHSKWFNYAFWVNAYLPRLIMAEEAGLLRDTVLLLPEGWKNIPYVWDTLDAFSFTPRFIPEGVHVFARKLYMPELRPWTASFYPPLIHKTAERLRAAAQKRVAPQTSFSRHVYLSRKKRGVRYVENEEEILRQLQKEGFEAIFFEDLSVWEQIAMMSRAERFISLHGAGLSNLMFMPPGAMVLELINEAYAHAEYTFPFWKLAHAVGLDYRALFCRTVNIGTGKLAREGTMKGNEADYLVNGNVMVSYINLSEILAGFKFAGK
jgi:hypothetical protein